MIFSSLMETAEFSLKNHLRGVLEIMAFLRQGVDKFGTGYADFLRSLAIPALIIPLSIPLLAGSPDYARYTAEALSVAIIYRSVMGLVFFLGAVWLLCRPLERKDKFYRFAVVYNWLWLPLFILLLPLLLIPAGIMTWDRMGYYILFAAFYGYALNGYLAWRALQVHWGVAIGIGVLGLITDVLGYSMLPVMPSPQ